MFEKIVNLIRPSVCTGYLSKIVAVCSFLRQFSNIVVGKLT